MSTTTPLTPEYVSDSFWSIFTAFENARGPTYVKVWNEVLIPVLQSNWLLLFATLIGLFIFASSIKVFTGRWALLGSVTYNYLYFGTLFVIGSIFGPEMFATFFIDIFLLLLYFICYRFVGRLFKNKDY